MKREILWRHAIAPVVLLAAVLSGCGDKDGESKAAESKEAAALELAAVDVAVASKGSLSGSLPINGSLQALTQTTVQSHVAAEVDAVAVREGEHVQKGQVLASLATQDLDARVKQAEANLASAQVEATLARALVERNKQLYEKKYFSEIDYQKSVGEAEAREENVRAQKALVAITRKALNDASVRSPMAGIVAKRYVEPGSNVGVDGKLFDIVDLSEMELAAPVPATEIAVVKVGQVVSFTISGFAEQKFTGKVVRINPVADAGTRAITVYVRVNNGGSALKGGMYARGEIATGAEGTGMTVPLDALRGDGSAGGSWVVVLNGGKLERRAVDVAARDERSNRLAVRTGLAEGDIVVVAKLAESVLGKPARLVQ